MKIKRAPDAITVWFSEDTELGDILVAMSWQDDQGNEAFPLTRRFKPWDDWETVSAWVWARVCELAPTRTEW